MTTFAAVTVLAGPPADRKGSNPGGAPIVVWKVMGTGPTGVTGNRVTGPSFRLLFLPGGQIDVVAVGDNVGMPVAPYVVTA